MSNSNVDAAMTVRISSVRGYSAYEIALQNGYVGTEQQWLASLSGNNCTINGVSHDANYDFKVNAANIPMSSAVNAAKISAKITELEGLIDAAEASITALQTALGGKLSTTNVYNDLDKTVSGYALDARQGTALKALVDGKASTEDLNELETKLNSKIGMSVVSITLPSSGWNSTTHTQTVVVTGVTVDSAVIVSGGSSTIGSYTTAGVYCSGQGEGNLTFTYTTAPTSNLAVNVMILGSEIAEEEEGEMSI